MLGSNPAIEEAGQEVTCFLGTKFDPIDPEILSDPKTETEFDESIGKGCY